MKYDRLAMHTKLSGPATDRLEAHGVGLVVQLPSGVQALPPPHAVLGAAVARVAADGARPTIHHAPLGHHLICHRQQHFKYDGVQCDGMQCGVQCDGVQCDEVQPNKVQYEEVAV